jgi:hypothetical protein
VLPTHSSLAHRYEPLCPGPLVHSDVKKVGPLAHLVIERRPHYSLVGRA